MLINITKFANRHFSSTFKGTKVLDMSPITLVHFANQAIVDGAELQDGYASFCKHLFIKNPGSTKAGLALITPGNLHFLRCGYEARREGELPILKNWFEGLEAPCAEFLDLVLYSRAALEKESEGKSEEERDVPDAEWGIVSINGELFDHESPLLPITMMRNALGKEEGGSGVPLDRAAYMIAVDFWSRHAVVK